MNINIIEDRLASAKKDMMDALGELEQANQESAFYLFAPLVRRAETITGKIESLEHIVRDLKNVRWKNA